MIKGLTTKLVIARSNGTPVHLTLGLLVSGWTQDDLKRAFMLSPMEDGEKSYCDVKVLWQPANDWACVSQSVKSVDEFEFDCPITGVVGDYPQDIKEALSTVEINSPHEHPQKAMLLYDFFRAEIEKHRALSKQVKDSIPTTEKPDEFNSRQPYGFVR